MDVSSLSKAELIEKLEGVYKYLSRGEELQEEREGCEGLLSFAEDKTQEYKDNSKKYTIHAIGSAVVAVVCIILNWVVGFFFGLAAIAAIVYGIVAAIRMIYNKSKIPNAEKGLGPLRENLGAAEKELSDFCAAMVKEDKDAKELFPLDDGYPHSSYIKLGLDGLKSGRVDNFKEVLHLIDEQKFREKQEAEAQETRELAEEAMARAQAAESRADAAERRASSAESQASAAKRKASNAEWNTFFNSK